MKKIALIIIVSALSLNLSSQVTYRIVDLLELESSVNTDHINATTVKINFSSLTYMYKFVFRDINNNVVLKFKAHIVSHKKEGEKDIELLYSKKIGHVLLEEVKCKEGAVHFYFNEDEGYYGNILTYEY